MFQRLGGFEFFFPFPSLRNTAKLFRHVPFSEVQLAASGNLLPDTSNKQTMRFNFDIVENNDERRRSRTPVVTSPKDEVEWVPLESHPLFTTSGVTSLPVSHSTKNLLAWDGSSRLYYWDTRGKCLHRISIKLGEPEPSSVLSASPSKVLQAEVQPDFEVDNISINRNGSAILLSGPDGLCVMYLFGRTSTNDSTTICRTVSVGSKIYFKGYNVIRALRALWHPYSDTHVGILSSDSVFRLFDLSLDIGQPEQEFYLQPLGLGQNRNAASICPVDFSFGGDHLWDRFSLFILFTDGSIYILCPVVPFGSVYKCEPILEIYCDAQTFGLKSGNPTAVRNSKVAISWLEATFPELTREDMEGKNLSALRAHPYAMFDVSLAMQGPLCKVCRGEEDVSQVRGAECDGRAVSFLYNLVSKDSVLVTTWSGGQLQIDALADEIQPVWSSDNPPRIRVDSHNHILGIAMICESMPRSYTIMKLDQSLDQSAWLGHSPPLLGVAIVDLALPKTSETGYVISMFVDPLIPERIYTVHDGGVDSVLLPYLPFTSQAGGKDEIVKAPSVHTVLSTCLAETFVPSPICGLATLSDSFGYSWIVGVMSSQECVVLEMKSWNELLPIQVDMERRSSMGEEPTTEPPVMISKELLIGPKEVSIPQSSSLRSVAADSIEGRSTLNEYYKLFHENYVEYAHKVFFELKHHGPQLKRILDDLHGRLGETQKKLTKVAEKQSILDHRVSRTVQTHDMLEGRLQRLRNWPGAHKRPLSKAEREFKSELDTFEGVELDALRSSIDALKARLKRNAHTAKGQTSFQQKRVLPVRRNHIQDGQISQLKSALEKLSIANSENSKKVKILESTLASREGAKALSPS